MKRNQFKPGDLVYWIRDEVPGINVFICLPYGADHIALVIRPGAEDRWRWVDELLSVT